jgi:ATP-dependent DNA ligase
LKLALEPPYAPMEARAVERIPEGTGWQYEPKWDGFRCLAFRDGAEVRLQSKAGESLTRYFPEVVAALRGVAAKRFVLDGELVVPVGRSLSFEDLLQRIHPAESRVQKLAASHPALYVVFDLLVDEKNRSLASEPLAERRPRLEQFAQKFLARSDRLALSPASRTMPAARKWLAQAGGALDGIMAKRLDAAYDSGHRDAMQKIKQRRTADCVVGGFRYASAGKIVGSLLLGMYDPAGLLHHVGFTSSLTAAARKALTPKLEALVKAPGFTGKAPGGPSRWSTKRSSEWQPLAPKLVVEVGYDQFTGGRFRHGTRFLRWRPDKAPAQCTLDTVERRTGTLLSVLSAGPRRPTARLRAAPLPRPRATRHS